MGIKQIIREEISSDSDWDWATDIKGSVTDVLDYYFGISDGSDINNGIDYKSGRVLTNDGDLKTWFKLKKTNSRELYDIVTDTKNPWYKLFFDKEYQDIKVRLNNWRQVRFYEIGASKEVQIYLANRGTADAGPR